MLSGLTGSTIGGEGQWDLKWPFAVQGQVN